MTAAATAPSQAQQNVVQALYNAGFRGFALAVMTAISGRETGGSYSPTTLNINQSTGDYSVGAFQINYNSAPAGQPIQINQSRVQQYGSPQSLLNSLQSQANAAYSLAGGNSLSGLSNWNLKLNGTNVPQPISSTDAAGQSVNYSINQYFQSAQLLADKITGAQPPLTGTGQQLGSQLLAGTAGNPTPLTILPTSWLVAYGDAMKWPSGLSTISPAAYIPPLGVRVGTAVVGLIVAGFGLTMVFGPAVVQFLMSSTGLGGLIKVATKAESEE